MNNTNHESVKSLTYIEDMLSYNNAPTVNSERKNSQLDKPLPKEQRRKKVASQSNVVPPSPVQEEYSVHDNVKVISNDSQSIHSVEKEILIEDINNTDSNVFKLRLDSDVVGRTQFLSTEQKDKVIQGQKDELLNLQVAYNSLTLKYKGVQNEFEKYKGMMSERLNRIDREMSEEARKEMKGELMAKQHTIAELTHEVKNYEMLVKSLRKKLNESDKERVAAQQRQLDIFKLQEVIQEEKDNLGKLEEELKNEREKNKQLITQVKELMHQCEEYADKDEGSSDLHRKNKELTEELILMKRENDDLKYQIAEWQNLVSVYEKRCDKQSKADSNEANSTLKEIKDQITKCFTSTDAFSFFNSP
jgi:chromosome segregation ATPase